MLAMSVKRKIVSEINNDSSGDTFIGVISDETSDISRNEQISLVISYIDSSGQKRESFLGFIQTDKTDGETLFKLMTDEMLNLGLDLSGVVGLGFDGAICPGSTKVSPPASRNDLPALSTFTAMAIFCH